MSIAFAPEGTYNPVRGTRTRIRLVNPEDVPEDYIDRVGPTQWAVSELLGLPEPPIICFFTLCGPLGHPDALRGVELGSGIGGFTFPRRPGEIFVRTGMSADRLERAIVHETRHVWQALHGYTDTHGREAREVDAHTFDHKWMEGKRHGVLHAG